jgi:hypothetical protein
MFENQEEFKQEDFDAETKAIFAENPALLDNLTILKEKIIKKIFEVLDEESNEVRVSLLVFTSF